ncbi:lipopolysaccharide biosynthesis protein [Bacteroidota bacterium]
MKKGRFTLKSEVLRNTSILVSGTALAQLIPILLQPVLRRYYTPETFGAYAVYLSLLGILIVVSSFKYELAIILPKKEKEAANIFFLALILNFLFNILIIILILVFKKDIAIFLNLSEEYIYYLYFVPIGTFLFNFYQSLNYWLIRKKSFFAISKNKFIRRGFEGSAQVGFKFLNVAQGLVIGDLIGHIANVASGIYQSIKNGLLLNYFSIVKIKYVFTKYVEYPKFNVFPSLLSACSYLLPVIFINKFFSSEYTGYFDLSKLVLSIPLALVATSIANVLLERISTKYKENQSFVYELYSIVGIVLFIAILEILIITLWGENLFKLFFGEQWGFSGEISRILVWSYAFNFFIASFSSLFISMKQIKILSIWQLFYFIAILSLFLFKNRSFINFIKVYVLIEVFCYMIITLLMIIIVVRYESKVKQIEK